MINGQDAYVGSAGGGEAGMNERMSSLKHEKAQALLSKPGTQVFFQEVDLGTASTRAEKEHILRHFEQREMDEMQKTGVELSNSRRAEALSKEGRNKKTIAAAGAGKIGKKERC